jgi:hypothetical protein
MLTIKSDDVYGRSKAYEASSRKQRLSGPKVPESFNVLVKELQGLGLKVDLVASDQLLMPKRYSLPTFTKKQRIRKQVEAPTPLSQT